MKCFSQILAAAMIIAILTPSADAGWLFGRRRAAACGVPVQYQVAPQPVAMQAVPIVGTVAVAGDAAGFVAWLNGVRASYGLPAVGYDGGMEAVCNENNRHQAVHGLGHHFLGHARRQNSAAGAGFPGVEGMWLTSPAHASALLDPGITRVGIAWYGAWCTFSAW